MDVPETRRSPDILLRRSSRGAGFSARKHLIPSSPSTNSEKNSFVGLRDDKEAIASTVILRYTATSRCSMGNNQRRCPLRRQTLFFGFACWLKRDQVWWQYRRPRFPH